MFCIHCGRENPEAARVCGACGSVVNPAGRGPDLESEPTFEGIPIGGLLLGRYRIEGLLGQGAMGSVYQAQDQELELPVAVKVIKPLLAHDPVAVRRLKEEARLSMKLADAHIVRVYNFEEAETLHLLVMEFVAGESLARRLAKAGRLEEPEVRRIGVGIARGLATAHEMKVIHRDLKPANILLTPAGEAKIADFGIARLAQDSLSRLSGQAVEGTFTYMAPEQILGRFSALSDLYSAGVILYEMLGGRPPFSREAIVEKVLRYPPPQLVQGSAQLKGIIEKLLAKDPKGRIQSAAELTDELLGRGKKISGNVQSQVPETEVEAKPVGPEKRGQVDQAIGNRAHQPTLESDVPEPRSWESTAQSSHRDLLQTGTTGRKFSYHRSILPLSAAVVILVLGLLWMLKAPRMELAPGEVLQLTNTRRMESGTPQEFSVRGCALSYDGRFVAFVNPADLVGRNPEKVEQVYWADAYENMVVQLTDLTLPNFAGNPSISGDGRRVVYYVSTSLFVFDVSRSESRLLSKQYWSSALPPAVSQDGFRVAYTESLGSGGRGFTWVLDIDSSLGVTEVARLEGRFPSLDSTGDLVAFSSEGNLAGGNPDGNEEIFLYSVATRRLRQVTDTRNGLNYKPMLSGDGGSVVYRTGLQDWRSERIMLAQVASGRITELAPPGMHSWVSISGTGSRIMLQTFDDPIDRTRTQASQIYLFETDKGVYSRVTEGIGASMKWSPSLSYDGSLFAYYAVGDLVMQGLPRPSK